MKNRLKSPSKEEQIAIEFEQANLLLEKINNVLINHKSISDEIFDSMSHELRSPVVLIKAYTDMLLDGKFGKLDNKQKEKLKIIKTQTNLLLDVIFKLLDKKRTLSSE